MKRLIRQLTENIYKRKNKVPSELFIESLITSSRIGPGHIDESYLKILLKQKSYKAYVIYENLKKNKTVINLVYVLLKLSDTVTPLIVELTHNVKKAALGFKVSHYNDTNIALLRGRVENHIFEIVFQIYQHACIFRVLKDNKSYQSMAMQYFNEIVREELKTYERHVVEQESDLLSFYVGMYSSYLRLKILHQVYECFKDNPRKPFEFLKLNFTTSQPFTRNIIEASARHLNNCLKSFVSRGSFEDEFGEFFIRQREGKYEMTLWDGYIIVDENIPYYISKELSEDILYIGRCLGLLKWISTNDGLPEIQCFCVQCVKNKSKDRKYTKCFKDNLQELMNASNHLDLLSKDINNDINTILNITNFIIEEVLINRYGLKDYIEGIKNIFLCGRADFLETLFHQLKKIKKLTKRSYGYVLDTALEDTVGYKNEFYSTLDVFLHENSNNYDNFTLFSNIPFPISIVITKEIVFDLSKIFKFLWIIKRVEHLLRRARNGITDSSEKIKIIMYMNLINRFYFYLFEELISPSIKKVLNTKNRRIVDLQINLQETIKNILKKMYIDYETKLFYRFIKQLEDLLLDKISNDTEFNDIEIKKILANTKYDTPNEFIESMIFDMTKIM